MNDKGDLVATSAKGQADYVVYSLMKDVLGKELAVSAVIIEAKHSDSLHNFIGQGQLVHKFHQIESLHLCIVHILHHQSSAFAMSARNSKMTLKFPLLKLFDTLAP